MTTEAMSPTLRTLDTTAYTSGSTHRFYLYPARFHPDVAREILTVFSRKGEWVMDPFMGGGTSIVEALALGRRVLGSDISALAQFVADVRTRPLSPMDKEEVRLWAQKTTECLSERDRSWVPHVGVVNLPRDAEIFLSGALELATRMIRRRSNFARTVLLRLGQLTIDCCDGDVPYREELPRRLLPLVNEMLAGLDSWVERCRESGIPKNAITSWRLLLQRNAVALKDDRKVQRLFRRARLVFTSPPYPGVHVLYHRWQYRGRRETSAPFWIADVTDGAGGAYYCGGSRTPTGLRSYFEMIARAFTSIGRFMHPDGHVVQIVGFSDVESQLPLYLDAMEEAGFRDVESSKISAERLQRRVANRRWYAKLKGDTDASTEFLLVHRLCRSP